MSFFPWFPKPPSDVDRIIAAINSLSNQLQKTENRIMGKIDTFLSAIEAHFDKQDASFANISGDVSWLKEQLQVFIDGQGELSPDQQARADALSTRMTSIEAQFEALDAMTPPKPPVG